MRRSAARPMGQLSTFDDYSSPVCANEGRVCYLYATIGAIAAARGIPRGVLMTQPYGQQPGHQPGQYGQPGGYPQSGGYPQAPTYAQGSGGLPQAPPDLGGGRPVEKPGSVTGAAVLAFIQAGLTLITTGILFIIAAAGTGANNDFDLELGGALAELWIVAFVQLAGIALLIFGAVQLMGGKARGLFISAVGLQIALCAYWLITGLTRAGGSESSTGTGLSVVIPLVFVVMPVIALILALGGAASQWIDSRRR
jgi:hypothetical protein